MRAVSFAMWLSALAATVALAGGVGNAMLGVPTGFEGSTITVGTNGTTSFGYGVPPGGWGALTPQNTFQGSTILATGSATSTNDFAINIQNGALAQSAFTSITVEDGAGTIRSYTSASATFTHPGGTASFWSWGTGSSPVYVVGDVGETHLYSINL